MPRTQSSGRFLALVVVISLSRQALGTSPSQDYSFYGGMPRRWQGAVSATPYSVVNMTNGNVLTIITLVRRSGRGPTVNISLFHNSFAAISGVSAPAGAGFTLGPGWRVSYGGPIVPKSKGEAEFALVIEDDGSANKFTKSGGIWVSPTGCSDTLTRDPNNGNRWTLTRKNQWSRIFL